LLSTCRRQSVGFFTHQKNNQNSIYNSCDEIFGVQVENLIFGFITRCVLFYENGRKHKTYTQSDQVDGTDDSCSDSSVLVDEPVSGYFCRAVHHQRLAQRNENGTNQYPVITVVDETESKKTDRIHDSTDSETDTESF